MHVKNHTKYSTRHIGSVIRIVYRYICKLENRKLLRWTTEFNILVNHSQAKDTWATSESWRAAKGLKAQIGGYSGCAYLDAIPHYWVGSKKHKPMSRCEDMTLRLPQSNATEHGLAWLAYHELMHSFGYHHKQYTNLQQKEMDQLFGSEDHKLTY